MGQKIYITNKSKNPDKILFGKKMTDVSDKQFIKGIHNYFVAGNNNGKADYQNPKNKDVAFENEYAYLDGASLMEAYLENFDSDLTDLSLAEFIKYFCSMNYDL